MEVPWRGHSAATQPPLPLAARRPLPHATVRPRVARRCTLHVVARCSGHGDTSTQTGPKRDSWLRAASTNERRPRSESKASHGIHWSSNEECPLDSSKYLTTSETRNPGRHSGRQRWSSGPLCERDGAVLADAGGSRCRCRRGPIAVIGGLIAKDQRSSQGHCSSRTQPINPRPAWRPHTAPEGLGVK